MADEKTIPIRHSMRKLFRSPLPQASARASGAVVRPRKVDMVALFWTRVGGFGVGESRTLARLRRAYQRATGQCLAESSFYDRLNAGMAKRLKAAPKHAFEAMLRQTVSRLLLHEGPARNGT